MIRKAVAKDHEAVWEIFKAVIQRGDTYVFLPDTPRKDLERHWFASYMETFVLEVEGEILGTYIIKPNQIGLGNHIANCSYMVHPKAQGNGYGKNMAEHSIQFARSQGYLAMQFNVVVSSNVGALRLWEKMGFQIIGTTPRGFRHPTLGLIDTHILHKAL